MKKMIQKKNDIESTIYPTYKLYQTLKLEKMDYNMLKTNAINAINALLEAQLMAVSRESGIDISILQKYVGDSSAPVIQEKKKRAPPKKKAPTTDVLTTDVPTTDVLTTYVPTTDVPTTDVPTTDVVNTEAQVVPPIAEKKKRAPAKKKVVEAHTETQATMEAVATSEAPVSEAPTSDVVVVEKKKRAPPKKKTEPVAEKDGTDPIVEEKKKRAPPKKKTEPVAEKDGTDPIVEEKKKRAPPKKKAEPEPVNKCKGCNKCEKTDEDGYCGKCKELEETDTVKLDDSGDEEEIEYVESSRHPVREVNISGTIYLVDNEDVAFLKSSKKRVGKYNRDKDKIQALNEEDSDNDSSSDDELPICDDM